MKSNYLLTLLLVFFLISCSDDDNTKPITLKDRDDATINLTYPNLNKYTYSLEGGDGNYSVKSNDNKIVTVEIISSTEFNISVIGLGETTVTITDKSQNKLVLNVTVDYSTNKFVVQNREVTIIGEDLTENEKKAIKEKYLTEIPVKVGGGYKFVYTDVPNDCKAIIYTDIYGSNGIETTFKIKESVDVVGEKSNVYEVLINNEKRSFVFGEYNPLLKSTKPITMALIEDITKKVRKEYPKAELVYTSQIVTKP